MISCVGLPPLIAVSCVPPAICAPTLDEFGAADVNNAQRLVILVNGLIVYVVDPLMLITEPRFGSPDVFKATLPNPLVGWLVAELSILCKSQSIADMAWVSKPDVQLQILHLDLHSIQAGDERDPVIHLCA